MNSFDPMVEKAKELGFRMGDSDFTSEDNPYLGNSRRLTKAWDEGFKAAVFIKRLENFNLKLVSLPNSWFKAERGT